MGKKIIDMMNDVASSLTFLISLSAVLSLSALLPDIEMIDYSYAFYSMSLGDFFINIFFHSSRICTLIVWFFTLNHQINKLFKNPAWYLHLAESIYISNLIETYTDKHLYMFEDSTRSLQDKINQLPEEQKAKVQFIRQSSHYRISFYIAELAIWICSLFILGPLFSLCTGGPLAQLIVYLTPMSYANNAMALAYSIILMSYIAGVLNCVNLLRIPTYARNLQFLYSPHSYQRMHNIQSMVFSLCISISGLGLSLSLYNVILLYGINLSFSQYIHAVLMFSETSLLQIPSSFYLRSILCTVTVCCFGLCRLLFEPSGRKCREDSPYASNFLNYLSKVLFSLLSLATIAYSLDKIIWFTGLIKAPMINHLINNELFIESLKVIFGACGLVLTIRGCGPKYSTNPFVNRVICLASFGTALTLSQTCGYISQCLPSYIIPVGSVLANASIINNVFTLPKIFNDVGATSDLRVTIS